MRLMLFLLLAGCGGRPTEEIALTQEQRDAYWSQLQRRLPAWFRKIAVPVPPLPDANTVYPRLRITEVSPADLASCVFREPNRIEIGSDKWASGCVPHELGHATLYLMGHPCWGEFEHPTEEQKCKERSKKR